MIKIREISIPELYNATLQIPEFEPHYPLDRYHETLEGVPFLLLGAFLGSRITGFKAGYAIGQGVFYSWVGGVLPAFRRQKIAKALADYQEQWLSDNGYHTLKMKTRNKFQNMLLFAIVNGFKISYVEQKGGIDDWRIWLEKEIERIP